MKPKNKDDIHAVTFNTMFAELTAACNRVKAEMKKNQPRIKDIAKRANMLTKFGLNKCVGKNIKGIKRFDEKMETLEILSLLEDDIKSIIQILDFTAKEK